MDRVTVAVAIRGGDLAAVRGEAEEFVRELSRRDGVVVESAVLSHGGEANRQLLDLAYASVDADGEQPKPARRKKADG